MSIPDPSVSSFQLDPLQGHHKLRSPAVASSLLNRRTTCNPRRSHAARRVARRIPGSMLRPALAESEWRRSRTCASRISRGYAREQPRTANQRGMSRGSAIGQRNELSFVFEVPRRGNPLGSWVFDEREPGCGNCQGWGSSDVGRNFLSNRKWVATKRGDLIAEKGTMTSPTVKDEIDDDSGEPGYAKFVQDESCKYVQVGEVVTCFKGEHHCDGRKCMPFLRIFFQE